MSAHARVAVLCVAAALAPAVAACSGGTDAHAPVSASSSGSSALVATRWWSNHAVKAGSTIDSKHPQSAAGRLHASKPDYCGMLHQTVAAGRSILLGATANDPALLTSTKAFVAEIEAVAPSAVSGPWQVLGGAVIALVGSGGDTTKVRGVDAAAVQRAADTVAADAKHSCGVDLASTAK